MTARERLLREEGRMVDHIDVCCLLLVGERVGGERVRGGGSRSRIADALWRELRLPPAVRVVRATTVLVGDLVLLRLEWPPS
jgi:hypothetical protein